MGNRPSLPKGGGGYSGRHGTRRLQTVVYMLADDEVEKEPYPVTYTGNRPRRQAASSPQIQTQMYASAPAEHTAAPAGATHSLDPGVVAGGGAAEGGHGENRLCHSRPPDLWDLNSVYWSESATHTTASSLQHHDQLSHATQMVDEGQQLHPPSFVTAPLPQLPHPQPSRVATSPFDSLRTRRAYSASSPSADHHAHHHHPMRVGPSPPTTAPTPHLTPHALTHQQSSATTTSGTTFTSFTKNEITSSETTVSTRIAEEAAARSTPDPRFFHEAALRPAGTRFADEAARSAPTLRVTQEAAHNMSGARMVDETAARSTANTRMVDETARGGPAFHVWKEAARGVPTLRDFFEAASSTSSSRVMDTSARSAPAMRATEATARTTARSRMVDETAVRSTADPGFFHEAALGPAGTRFADEAARSAPTLRVTQEAAHNMSGARMVDETAARSTANTRMVVAEQVEVGYARDDIRIKNSAERSSVANADAHLERVGAPPQPSVMRAGVANVNSTAAGTNGDCIHEEVWEDDPLDEMESMESFIADKQWGVRVSGSWGRTGNSYERSESVSPYEPEVSETTTLPSVDGGYARLHRDCGVRGGYLKSTSLGTRDSGSKPSQYGGPAELQSPAIEGSHYGTASRAVATTTTAAVSSAARDRAATLSASPSATPVSAERTAKAAEGVWGLPGGFNGTPRDNSDSETSQVLPPVRKATIGPACRGKLRRSHCSFGDVERIRHQSTKAVASTSVAPLAADATSAACAETAGATKGSPRGHLDFSNIEY